MSHGGTDSLWFELVCLHPALQNLWRMVEDRARVKCVFDASVYQQLRVVKSSFGHSCSFVPVVLISLQCLLDCDLRPPLDRPWLIRLSSYSGASEILLSAAMIYDTISRGGLDWLRPLPLICQGCGRKCCCYHQTSHWEHALSLPAYFHITPYLRKYWTRDLGPPPRAVLH